MVISSKPTSGPLGYRWSISDLPVITQWLSDVSRSGLRRVEGSREPANENPQTLNTFFV